MQLAWQVIPHVIFEPPSPTAKYDFDKQAPLAACSTLLLDPRPSSVLEILQKIHLNLCLQHAGIDYTNRNDSKEQNGYLVGVGRLVAMKFQEGSKGDECVELVDRAGKDILGKYSHEIVENMQIVHLGIHIVLENLTFLFI